MNVILLDNVENLGNIGDLVKVKPGYGRNYLLPQGKAALATPENMRADRGAPGGARKGCGRGTRHQRMRAQPQVNRRHGTRYPGQCRSAKTSCSVRSARSTSPDAFEAVQIEVRAQRNSHAGRTNSRARRVYEIGLHLHPEVDVEVKIRVVAD